MIIIIALILLTLLFFAIRKHVGPAHLAVIAGVTVYESFGQGISEFIQKLFESAPIELLNVIVYLVLIFAMPIILYFRSGRGGLFGIMRIIEAVIFSALLVSLCSWCIAYFAPFDELSSNILNFIDSIKGIIIGVGVGFAYLDILLYRDEG